MSPAEERMLDDLVSDQVQEGVALCQGLADLIARTTDPKDQTLLTFVLHRLPWAYPQGVVERLAEPEEKTRDMD